MIGQIGVAVDIETTGLIDGIHDIIQIALVAYDENYDPLPGLFFKSNIKPTNPKMADPKALEINGLSLKELDKAPTPSQVRVMLLEWKEEIFADRKLIPLGHNYDGFDKPFIKKWLNDFYFDVFHYHAIDSWQIANICRDLRLIKDEGLSLSKLKEQFSIHLDGHDAYNDALACLKVYKTCLGILKKGIEKGA